MPRAKKRKTLAQNQAQFSRSVKNNKGKYRGHNPPKSYKRKGLRKPKRIWDKEPFKVEYQPKCEENEDFFAKQ